jgi:hypothetical protein
MGTDSLGNMTAGLLASQIPHVYHMLWWNWLIVSVGGVLYVGAIGRMVLHIIRNLRARR